MRKWSSLPTYFALPNSISLTFIWPYPPFWQCQDFHGACSTNPSLIASHQMMRWNAASRVGWSASHWAAQSAGKSRGGTSKNINYPNFGQVGKQISFRELWRRIKFLSTTFAFSASNCGALGAAAGNTKDFSPLCYFNSDELFVWAMVPLLY